MLVITIEEIQEVNKKFADGEIINSSIYYAIEQTSLRDKLSHILRSLVIDHPFHDGNKRTAFIVALLIFERANIKVSRDSLTKLIIKMARENIININEINKLVERCIKK